MRKNTPVIDVTKANVWIVDYSKEYKYQSSETTKEENNHKDMEDTDYKRRKKIVLEIQIRIHHY